MSKTAQGLIEFCRSKIGTPYVYGAKGEVCSREKIIALQKQYGKGCVWDSDLNKAGKVCVDCSGLISWYTGIIRGSSQYYATAVERIPISQINDSHIGWAVWLKGHIGVYIGGGKYIAADGSQYGVREAAMSCQNWTYALKLCDIDYGAGTQSDPAAAITPSGTATYNYTVGDYTIVVDGLRVRDGHSTSARVKALNELTASAQRQGGYVKGVTFTALEVWNGAGESWARTPSGWVCIQNASGVYCTKGGAATPSVSTYGYTVGNYQIIVDRMNVRTGAGKNYPTKALNQLTASAQRQGGYVRGVVFTAQEVVNNPGESWARTPSGWICLQNADGVYANRV